MGKHRKSPEAVEKVKTLSEMGWSNIKIGKELGVHESTIRKWLQEPDPEEIHDELEALRARKRKQYVDEAWEIALMGLAIARDDMRKHQKSGSHYKNPKDPVIISAIMVDKIGIIEARRGGAKPVTPPISITILPPSDGHTTRIEQDAVPVYDLDGEVLSDGSWCGERENILRLPSGCDDGPGEREVAGCDSGLDVQEP